jgi:hypothetical protein
MRKTVEILLDVWPQSVRVKDDKQKTAMQYAHALRYDPDFKSCADLICADLGAAEEHVLKLERESDDAECTGMIVEMSGENKVSRLSSGVELSCC